MGTRIDHPHNASPDAALHGTEASAREVFGPLHGPLDKPADKLQAGNLFVEAEELIPELSPIVDAELDKLEAQHGFGFSVDRRDLLKAFSASAIMASAACVRRPAEKVLPYVNQPIDQPPGVAVHYATTCGDCGAGCGVVVRTREGRPVKVEGNPQHVMSQGGLCASGQATLQGLYHPERRVEPLIRRSSGLAPVSWDDLVLHVSSKIKGKKRVGILAESSTGSRVGFFKDFLTKIGADNKKVYLYDSNTLGGAISRAHEMAFGISGIPRADLTDAGLVVGIGSDFLDVGTAPVYFAKSFARFHSLSNGKIGKFVQFESHLTQTGAKADQRHVIAPGYEAQAALLLVRSLADHRLARGSHGQLQIIQRILTSNAALLQSGYDRLGIPKSEFDGLADELLSKKSLVLVGGTGNFDENHTRLQLLAVAANVLIGAYGSTLRFDHGWIPYSNELGIQDLFSDADTLDALFIVGVNPAFTLPPAFGFAEKLKSIPVVVSMQDAPTETDELATHLVPVHHYLESWGDAEPLAGFWSLRQPVVRPTTNSRQAEDVLMWVAAELGAPMGYASYREYIKSKWRSVYSLLRGESVDFETFFKMAQRQGFYGTLTTRAVPEMRDVSSSALISIPPDSSLRLVSPFDGRLLDGRGANKPVLQEVGDGLTTIAWDTWLGLHPETAKNLKLKRNDVVVVKGPGGEIELAVYPMPGLHPAAAVIHRGNGHHPSFGRVSEGVGANPLELVQAASDPLTGTPITSGVPINLAATGKVYRLAAMQKTHEIGNRSDIVKKISVSAAAALADHDKDLDQVPDMYPQLKEGEYRWGMSVDLSKCTGCGACMVACAQENNIPQVGREEILKGREMHWIRLDRYFEGSMDNPHVSIQPMLCQHCNHAPCEAVCPVYATVHDVEGLNSQAYNRCVGTRYCANACPYKVRRFNWYTHRWNQVGDLARDRNLRALNPDVTVRTRGIMEKCTFCVHRIREAKHAAKQMARQVRDGELKTACQQTCPSDAIEFGNLLDMASRVYMARHDGRAYLALGGEPEHGHYGIKTLPNVNYMMQIVPDGSAVSQGQHGHGEGHG